MRPHTMKVYFILFFPLFVPTGAADDFLTSNNSSVEDFLNNTSLRAYENSQPYIVSIEKTVLRKSTTSNQCTGMLVSPNWVSTSCTCLWQMNKEDGIFTWPPAILFRLMAGVTDKNSRFPQVRFAIKILYHQQCNFKLKTMDVALMRANYPFSEKSFILGKLIPFPVASQQVEFIGAGLDTFIRRRLTCAVLGWPSARGHKFDFLLELNVVLVKDEECGEITCSYAPGLCVARNTHAAEHRNYSANSKGIGFVCAKTINSWPPCTGFEGAPLVCGTNVWATVTAVKPCNETSMNGSILMTRMDVQFDFLKSKISGRCSNAITLLSSFLVTLHIQLWK